MPQMIGMINPILDKEVIFVTSDDGTRGVDILNDNGTYRLNIVGTNGNILVTTDRAHAINFAEGVCSDV